MEAGQKQHRMEIEHVSAQGLLTTIIVGAIVLEKGLFTGQEALCILRAFSLGNDDCVGLLQSCFLEENIRNKEEIELKLPALSDAAKLERFLRRYPYLLSHVVYAIAKGIDKEFSV